MNKVIIAGYVGGCEVKRLENGTPVAKMTVATSKSYKDKNDEWQTLTTWHDVVLWRGQAEKAEKIVKKGSFVVVEGELTSRNYDRKVKSPSGEEFTVKSTSVEIVADSFECKETVKSEKAAPADAPVETTHVAPQEEEDLF